MMLNLSQGAKSAEGEGSKTTRCYRNMSYVIMTKKHRSIYLVQQSSCSLLTVQGSVLDAEGTKTNRSVNILQRGTRGKHRFNHHMLIIKPEVSTED